MGQHKTSIHWERDTEHFNIKSFNRDPVSYTHLTLPTILRV